MRNHYEEHGILDQDKEMATHANLEGSNTYLTLWRVKMKYKKRSIMKKLKSYKQE